MSTKINTLELYVKGVQAYPNNEAKSDLEEATGYWPDNLDDSAILATRLAQYPTNTCNFNLWYDYYRNDNTWHNYWSATAGSRAINIHTPIYWPEYTSTQLSSITDKYDLGGPDCMDYPNPIYIQKGIRSTMYEILPGDEIPVYDYTIDENTLVSYQTNAVWNYLWDQYGHIYGLQNNRCTELTFGSPNTFPFYLEDGITTTTRVDKQFRWMFEGCKALKQINNLNLSSFSMEVIDHNGGIEGLEYMLGLERYFYDCQSLTTLQCTWPQTFTGFKYSYMFYNCLLMGNAQFPTITFANPGNAIQWDDEAGEDISKQIYIDCSYMFYGCNNLTDQKVTTSSFQYVIDLVEMYAYSGVTSIELPANMNVNSRLYYMINGCSNLTQLIIRTEGLSSNYAYTGDDIWGRDNHGNGDTYEQDNKLFDPWGTDKLNANLAIYVPDNDLSDWVGLHAVTGDEDTDLAIEGLFHGLSELNN